MADCTVVLVADDGHETRVPSTIIAAASTVWSERLAIAPPEPGTETKSVESVSHLAVEAFVGVITLLSHSPTLPTLVATVGRGSPAARLQLRVLTSALTLVHKYDCTGARGLIGHLAEWHFPKCSYAGGGGINGVGEQEDVRPISHWLTQQHLDYILAAQELFPEVVARGSSIPRSLGCLSLSDVRAAAYPLLRWIETRMRSAPSS
jgi:hypothetical protein